MVDFHLRGTSNRLGDGKLIDQQVGPVGLSLCMAFIRATETPLPAIGTGGSLDVFGCSSALSACEVAGKLGNMMEVATLISDSETQNFILQSEQ